MADQDNSNDDAHDEETGADTIAAGTDDTRTTESWAPVGGQTSIDDMARTLSTFGMRLDALVTSTTSYRAAITDRLVEYADTVNRLVKNQSADLDEHRHANQRLLAELQRGITTSDDTVGRLGDRIDELLRAGDGDDTSRQILSEVRSVLDAQERLGQFLTEALDQFGDRVTDRLDAGHAGTLTQLDTLVDTIGAVQRSDRSLEDTMADLSTELRGIREVIVDLASGDVVAALWDEVRGLRDSLNVPSATSSVAWDPNGGDAARLADAVEELLSVAEVVPPEESDALGALAGDIAQLRADLTNGRLVEPDALAALARDVAQLRADLTEGLLVEPDAVLADDLASIRTGVERILQDVGSDLSAVRTSLADGVSARPTAELSDALDAIRAGVDALFRRLDELAMETGDIRWPGAPDPGPADEPTDELGDEPADERQQLADDVRAARDEVAAIARRLDQGLVIDTPADGETAERISAMRREVTTELEAVRQLLADAIDRRDGDEVEMVIDLEPIVAVVNELRDDIRGIPAAVADPGRAEAAIDDLRDEVRALAEVPDSLIESLRAELVALRRRIKVRSESEILSDDQLDRIAQAVADRLE